MRTLLASLLVLASCTEFDIFLEAAGGEGTVYDCTTTVPFRGTTSPEVCFFDDSAEELGDRIGGVCSKGNERKWVILTNTLGLILVDNDALSLVDGLHYSSDGHFTLGQWTAAIMLDTFNLERRSIETSHPQIVGFAPAVSGSGAISPESYGLPKDGDLEILLVGTGLGDGAGFPTLSTAAGFVAIASAEVTCQFSTLDQNAKAWARVVTQATLDANGGRMPAPTVADTNAFNAAVIFSVRGPDALALDDVEAVGTAKNDAYDTALTMAGVTTVAANELVMRMLTAYSGSGTNTAALTDAGLTDVTEVHDGVYTIGSDYQMLYLATGVKTTAGATGNASVTTGSQAMMAGLTLGVCP